MNDIVAGMYSCGSLRTREAKFRLYFVCAEPSRDETRSALDMYAFSVHLSATHGYVC